MATYRSELVVGTNDWAYLTVLAYPQLAPWAADLVEFVLRGDRGFDLWASCDGVNWRAITRDAFGGNRYDFGARTLAPAAGELFVGSANPPRVRRCGATAQTTAPARPRPARRGEQDAPAHPPGADDRRAAGGDRPFVALGRGGRRHPLPRHAATYTDVPLGLSRPDVMPNGFPLEERLAGSGRAGGKGLEDRRCADDEGLHHDRDDPQPVLRRPDGATRRALRLSGGGRGAVGGALGPVERAGRPGPALRAVARRRGRPRRGRDDEPRCGRRAAARRATLRRVGDCGARRARLDRRLLLERLERRVRYAGIAEGR